MVLVRNYLSGWVVIFALLGPALSCNMKWLRYVYMMSCGKRKRENTLPKNETFFESVPRAFDDAFQYLRSQDPFDPIFGDDVLLREMLQEEEDSHYLLSSNEDIDSAQESMRINDEKPSVLMRKLFPNSEKWNGEDSKEGKVNQKRKTKLDELIEECCRIPPVKTCNQDTFKGAC